MNYKSLITNRYFNPCRYGVNQVGYGTAGTPNRDSNVLSQLQFMGCTTMRIGWQWSDLQPTNTTPFWSGPDGVLAACKKAGIVPIFAIYSSPSWANGGLSVNGVPTSGSGTDTTWQAAYATYFASWVTRYGHQAILEVWNEPNTNYSGSFWMENDSTTTLPKFAQYLSLFNGAYTAAKAIDSKVVVSVAGMAALTEWGDAFGTPGVTYLQSLMTNNIIADQFSGHAYTGSGVYNPATDSFPTGNSFKDIARLQAAMISGGYGKMPLRIGEFGNYSAATAGSEAIKAGYVSAAYQLVESTYSVRVVGPGAAGVVSCCYFSLNNSTNGTSDTSDTGLWTGTPLVGPNTILASGTALRTFLTSSTSPVSGVALFYNSAPATPMLLFTGTTYTMVAKDQSGNVLSGVGTWTTTDGTNAPINSSTGVISPAAGIGGGTITYTHTASGKTASVVFSVLKTPGAIYKQGGTFTTTAALSAQIWSALGVDPNYNGGTPAGTNSAQGTSLYQDGAGVNHYSVDSTTTSRQFMGSPVMVDTIPTVTPVQDGFMLTLMSGITRTWALQLIRFDPGFTLVGTTGGAASFKIGSFLSFSPAGRIGRDFTNGTSSGGTGGAPGGTFELVSELSNGSTQVGGYPGGTIGFGTVTTEFSVGDVWCHLLLYEVRGGNIMSSRDGWFKIGTVPNLTDSKASGIVEGPMTGGPNPTYTPPSPTEYQPTPVNYNQAPPVSQLACSIPLWQLVNGDTYGDPFGVLADTSSPTLTGIVGGTITRGDTADSIVLTGTNFTVNCHPKFSSIFVLPQSITINSSTQMTVVVAVNSGATPGAATVTINNQSSQANSATQPILIL